MVTKRVITPARAGQDGSPATAPGALDDLGGIPAAPASSPTAADNTPTVPETAAMPAAAAYEEAEAYEPPSRAHPPARSSGPGPFLPLLLLSLAWVLWMAFQLVMALNDKKALRDAHAQQQQTVDKSAQLRAALDALATDTQRLAEAGNPNARSLVDELKRRGVTITPAGASAPK